MPGNIILGRVYEFFSAKYHHQRGGFTISILADKIKSKDTYVLIFSRQQKGFLQALLDYPNIKILFKSKPCINPKPDHRTSRNTVVVFERKE
jgi:hypothetical protein